MRRLTAAVAAALLILPWIGAARPARRHDAVFDEVDRIVAELARISGMEARRKVACELISRENVNQFLKQRVKEVATPAEIRAEELTLQKFGLIPPGFDLASSTIDLLTEQAAAFYDFHKKRLFITDTTASVAREAALVHELAHAVADQNFNLDRFIKGARNSDDGALARMAVMEGQATWLMSEYLARRMGQSLKSSPSLVEMMSRSTEAAAGQYPVFERAPLYMRVTLVFPYTGGMLFQQALVEREGTQGFATVFRRPPVSTQQIIHPEKYLAGTAPSTPDLPAFFARGYKELTAGTFGELDHRILLEQYAGKAEADSMAPHWRGGRYQLRENRAHRRQVLLYVSEWDTEEAARRYFSLYRTVLRKKWKKMDVAADTPDRLAGIGDDGFFTLYCRNRVVTSVEGAEAATDAALH